MAIINDRLDIKNYIQDSMDLQIIRGLLLKSRHKILMPILSIELANAQRIRDKKRKANQGKFCSSWVRNINNADDMPVFDIGSAIKQLRQGLHKSEVEKLVDDFFLKYLPEDILKMAQFSEDSEEEGDSGGSDVHRGG